MKPSPGATAPTGGRDVRIGVMLRHFDQHHGGVRVYTRRLLDAILELDSAHEFVLLYRNPALLGTNSGRPRVEEHALEAGSDIASVV